MVLVMKNAICHEETSHKYEAIYFYRLLFNCDDSRYLENELGFNLTSQNWLIK
jgi:hypothetical protein